MLFRSIVTHNLEQRVLFWPAVKQAELPRFYVAADAGCWPREASMAMLEAAACGLPIIIAKGELEQRVRYGNGLEYQEGNINNLSECITQLAQNLDQTRQMGYLSRRLVEEHYSWTEINRQFMAAYQP